MELAKLQEHNAREASTRRRAGSGCPRAAAGCARRRTQRALHHGLATLAISGLSLTSNTPRYRHMWALTVAIIYFGTFLLLGYIAKVALDKLMDRTGANYPMCRLKPEQTAGRAKSSSWVCGALRIEAGTLTNRSSRRPQSSPGSSPQHRVTRVVPLVSSQVRMPAFSKALKRRFPASDARDLRLVRNLDALNANGRLRSREPGNGSPIRRIAKRIRRREPGNSPFLIDTGVVRPRRATSSLSA
jgi:hypothetical protein